MTITLFICKRESIKVYLWGSVGPQLDGLGDTLRLQKAPSLSETFKTCLCFKINSYSSAATLILDTCTESPEALPIVPQVHCTFFNFAKDFKAALQLCPGAVGPQSPHVHHPSLLLLVKRKDRAKEGD